MSKGKALIEARRILGPSGHVRKTAGWPPFAVGVFGKKGFDVQGWGRTWEDALKEARRNR